MADAATSIFCLLYVGFTLIAVVSLHEEANGPSLVHFYCVSSGRGLGSSLRGPRLGRHKLAPTLSPKKTWEGSMGSLAGSLLMAGGLIGLAELLTQWDSAVLSYPGDIWYWLGLAVVVNVAAQVAIWPSPPSALLRRQGLRQPDSRPRRVLDRIDALLLAAPVLWYAQVIHQSF